VLLFVSAFPQTLLPGSPPRACVDQVFVQTGLQSEPIAQDTMKLELKRRTSDFTDRKDRMAALHPTSPLPGRAGKVGFGMRRDNTAPSRSYGASQFRPALFGRFGATPADHDRALIG